MKRIPLIQAVFLAFTATAFCQTTAPAPAPASGAPTTTVRATTRLVQVSVIALDANGKPVSDLRADEITLRDKNRPQHIAFFAPPNAPEPAPKLPPGVYTNRMPNVPLSMNVVLIDALNTSVRDQLYARQQLLKFLSQIQQGDNYGVYMLSDTQLRVIQDMTSDGTKLAALVAGMNVQGGTLLDSAGYEINFPTGNPTLDEVVQRMHDVGNASMLDQRIRRTARALTILANHLARYPGRKNLIWVSAGFPFQFDLDEMRSGLASPGGYYPEVEEAARALSNNNVAVYPVDARGLVGAPANDNSDSSPSAGYFNRRTGSWVSTNGPSGPLFDEHATMDLFAEGTGGQAFYGTNDVQDAIRRAVEQSQQAYTVGFYPEHGKWDGTFHALKLQCRRKGIRLLYRHGYYAFAEQPDDQARRQAMLRMAATSSVDAGGVGIIVRLANDPKDPKWKLIDILIDPTDLRFHEEGQLYLAQADLYVVMRAGNGELLQGWKQVINFHLTPEQYEKEMHSAVHVVERGTLNSRAESIVVVARDAATGDVGSVNVPLTPAEAPGK